MEQQGFWCLGWILVNTAVSFSENAILSKQLPWTHLKPMRTGIQWSQCSNLPYDITPDSKHDVSDLLRQWKGQCAYNYAYTGLWFSHQKAGAGTSSHLPIDAKCCNSPVDNTLSSAIIDLHNIDRGPMDISKTWNVECPANSFITALRTSVNTKNGYSQHLSGVKCALLINFVVDYRDCKRIDLTSKYGGSKDPAKPWRAECPSNMRLVALYDDARFTSIKYGKCCAFTAWYLLGSLPWKCTFSRGSLCGWTNRSDLKLTWEHESASRGALNYLSLGGMQTLGKAQLLSPGLPPFSQEICLRLQYILLGSVVLNVFKRSYVPSLERTNVTRLSIINAPKKQHIRRDIMITSEYPFQIILEGLRESSNGRLNIIQIAFLNLSDCTVCSPPAKGCEENEKCLVVDGSLRCVCKNGYLKVNGRCQRKTYTVPLTTISKPVTTSGNPGNRGGGSGKSEGDGDKTPSGKTVGGKVLTQPKSVWGSWVYTAIGATAGIFLVLIFVFGFMMYRRKVHHNRHSFRMEMGRPYINLNPVAVAVENRVAGAELLQSHTENVYVDSPLRARIDSVWSSSAGAVEQQLDSESSMSGSPNSHHYHELEPEINIMYKRRVSQFTLCQPIYGSTEDLFESNGHMFSEPPFDEDELLNKLGREIAYHAITLKEEIGHGAFGFVKLGFWDKHNNERIKVAVKMLKEPTTAEDRVKFLQEAAIMRQFDHTNVVRMYGIVTRFCSPMIVLEYMSNKNLKKYLHRLRKTREKANLGGVDYEMHRLFLRMAREISAGMCYLHSLKFVHRDLAARNILLDSNLVCKIGDFGLARDLIGCEYYESGGGVIPVRWTAPEAINYKRYSSASDTWSFGITLYEIWSLGIKPYLEWDNKTVMDKVDQGFRLPPPLNCPRVVYHLMIDCWHPEESKRPTASQIKFCLSHHDDRLIGRVPRMERIRSVTCNDIVDNEEQGLYDDLQYIYCKTE